MTMVELSTRTDGRAGRSSSLLASSSPISSSTSSSIDKSRSMTKAGRRNRAVTATTMTTAASAAAAAVTSTPVYADTKLKGKVKDGIISPESTRKPPSISSSQFQSPSENNNNNNNNNDSKNKAWSHSSKRRRNRRSSDDDDGNDDGYHDCEDDHQGTGIKNRGRRNQEDGDGGGDGVVIVVTETAHERMRMMSLLSLGDDPIDDPTHNNKNKLKDNKRDNGTLPTECSSPIPQQQQQKQQQQQQEKHELKPSSSSALSRHHHADKPQHCQVENGHGNENDDENDDDSSYELLKDVDRQDDVKDGGVRDHANHKRLYGSASADAGEVISQPPLRLLRQTISGDFVPPAALQSEDSIRHRRTKSLDDNECLVELEFRAAMNASTQTGGFHGAFVDIETASDRAGSRTIDDDNDIPAGNDKTLIIRSGMEIRGVICPTEKQRRLMRKVSALGMEDPVFGNISEQVKPSHASNIFDDMDFADVPADMQDMISMVSDKTDIVEMDDDIFESPQQGTTRSSAVMHTSGSRGIPTIALHGPASILHPLGLDPEASMNVKEQTTNQRPPSSPRKFTRQGTGRTSTSTKKTATQTNSESTSNSTKKAFQVPYIPPTGSFNQSKKKPITSRSSSCVVPDNVLAAQVDAMFQQSMPIVNTNNLNNSASSLFDESFNTLGSNGYKPAFKPQSPPSTRQRGKNSEQLPHRALPPSVNSLFPISNEKGECDDGRGKVKGRECRKAIQRPRKNVDLGRKMTAVPHINKAASSVFVPSVMMK